jgi:hypothetical protein
MQETDNHFENDLKKVSVKELEKAFTKTIQEITGTIFKLDCIIEKITFGPGWSDTEIVIKIKWTANAENFIEEFFDMFHIRETIRGIPYSRNRTRGKPHAAQDWTDQIIKQTENIVKVKDACLLRITFKLPLDHFPPDYPFGNDLDNLLKRFLDALSKTVFSEARGKDSCVIALEVMKVKVDRESEAGADFEILPIKVG